MAHIEFVDVTFTYAGQREPAVQQLNLQVEQGQWIVVCGPSGCGKTTLLKLLKPDLLSNGEQLGHVRVNGKSIHSYTSRERAVQVALVSQHAEQHMVMDRVTEELVFSMENVGLPPELIRKRLAEMAQLMDITPLLDESTMSLSGGQQQVISLASVFMLQPDILLLDEPLAQLDPMAVSQLMQFLTTIHREYGMTIIMTAHRLEEVWGVADDIWFMQQGNVVAQRKKFMWDKHIASELEAFIPSTVRLMHDLGYENAHLSTPHDMRRQLARCTWTQQTQNAQHVHGDRDKHPQPMIEAHEVRYRYLKERPWICNQLAVTIWEGDIVALCGANGSGKSTLLQLLAGLLKPQSGRITRLAEHSLGYVSQQPMYHFLEESVEIQLRSTIQKHMPASTNLAIHQVAATYGLAHRLSAHPHDLSGGERQLLALACAMMPQPRILVLDEPTKGIDPIHKQIIKTHLQAFQRQGMTIVLATHDIEFAAELANRCLLLFDGTIVADDTPERFLTSNYFYTTAVHRLVRQWAPQALHRGDVMSICQRES